MIPGGREGLMARPRFDGLCAGTRVDTPLGEVAVEHLGPGDAVLLAGGGVGIVTWIGRDGALPCLTIAAGALDGRLPRRSLRIGRDQAVLAAPGLLVPAHLLFPCSEVPAAGPFFQIAFNDGACLCAEGVALGSADGPADVVATPRDRRPGLTTGGPGLAAARAAIGAASALADPAVRTVRIAAAVAAIDALRRP